LPIAGDWREVTNRNARNPYRVPADAPTPKAMAEDFQFTILKRHPSIIARQVTR
jgi:hypothetical protein